MESVWVPAQGARLFANIGLLHGSTNSDVNKFVPNPTKVGNRPT